MFTNYPEKMSLETQIRVHHGLEYSLNALLLRARPAYHCQAWADSMAATKASMSAGRLSYGFAPLAWESSVTQNAPTLSVVISCEMRAVGGLDGPSVKTMACCDGGVAVPKES